MGYNQFQSKQLPELGISHGGPAANAIDAADSQLSLQSFRRYVTIAFESSTDDVGSFASQYK
jgi:hypothetical protein